MNDGPFNALRNLLDLPSGTLSAEQQAALVLVRAVGELGRRSQDSEHTRSMLARWMLLADPTAAPALVPRLLDMSVDTFFPTWLRGVADDPSVFGQLPGPLLVAVLIATSPPGRNDAHEMEYVAAVAELMRVPTELFNDVHGWIRGTAAEDTAVGVDATLQQLSQGGRLAAAVLTEIRVHAADRPRVREQFAEVFAKAQAGLERCINEIVEQGSVLGVDPRGLNDLREYLQQDRFRVAVLGEFKRGKSTLINALVGAPGLLPADILPSTSALIALRYGGRRKYEHRTCAPGGRWEPGTEAEFRSNAGAAAKWTTGRDIAPEGMAEKIMRWRVELPSSFLQQTLIELVDTPGLGEDPARDWVAKREAQMSDAAIVVLNCEQITSTQELDLVADMKSKAESLVIAINRADTVPRDRWPELRAHARSRLDQKGVSLPEERVVFVSARGAEDAVKRGAEDEWRALLGELVQVTLTNIVARRGAHKARRLCSRATMVSSQVRNAVHQTLAVRKRNVQEIKDHDALVVRAEQEYAKARDAVAEATAALRQSGDAERKLQDAFAAELPKIFERTRQDAACWTSEHFEVTSPKKHVEEVAGKIRDSLLRQVEAWVKDKETGAGAVVAGSLLEKVDALRQTLAPLRHYLEGAGGGDGDKIITDLLIGSLEDAFGADLVEPDSTTALVRVAVMSALAVVVGYAVADIILYYVLGVISGFANPLLLAAALIVSIGAYALAGRDWVLDWIRNKVFESLSDAMQNEKNQDKLKKALAASVRKVFEDVSRAFRDRAGALVSDAKYQYERLARERTEKRATLGDPDALAAELLRLEDAARRVERSLGNLDVEVQRIRAELAG